MRYILLITLVISQLTFADTFIYGKKVYPGPIDVTGATTGDVLKLNANGVFVPAADDSGTGTTPENTTAYSILRGTGTAWVEEPDVLVATDGAITTNGQLTVKGTSSLFGVNDTTTGHLTLYGNSTTVGGYLDLYNGANSDTTTEYWRLNADSAGGFSIANASTNLLTATTGSTLLTITPDLTVTGGDLTLGVSDSVAGNLTLMPPATGEAGHIYFRLAADVDDYIDYWRLCTLANGSLQLSHIGGSRGSGGDLLVDDDTGLFTFTGGIAASSTLTITGATALNGGLALDTNKFTVADTTGNTAIAGTLTTTGATVLNGGLTMDTNKFTVADTTGNTAIGGTLGVTGATSLTGNLAIATDKFTVAAASGDTAIAGDLTLSAGDITVSGGNVWALGLTASASITTSDFDADDVTTTALHSTTSDTTVHTFTAQTITSGTTIDASAGNLVIYNLTTGITVANITNPTAGQILYIVNDSNTSVIFTDGALARLADTYRVLSQGDILVLLYTTAWSELSYSNN